MMIDDKWRWAHGISPAGDVPSQKRLTVAVLAHIRTVHMNSQQLTGYKHSLFHGYLLRGYLFSVAHPISICVIQHEELSEDGSRSE